MGIIRELRNRQTDRQTDRYRNAHMGIKGTQTNTEISIGLYGHRRDTNGLRDIHIWA